MNKTSYWRLFALICGLSLALCRAQPSPVFPSDGRLPGAANGALLMQAVCPGKVTVESGEIACGKTCPAFTSFAGDNLDWRLSKVTEGHFVSPVSDDIVLSMDGCEPHSENFGGSILLTRKSGGWIMQWYKAGVMTSQCHKVMLQDSRDILVCIGEAGTMGVVSTELYVEDLLRPAGALMAEDEDGFFATVDTVRTCGYNPEDVNTSTPVASAFIEKVEFSNDVPAAVTVTASYGRRETTPGLALACEKTKNGYESIAPPVKSYQVRFAFDGRDYKPTRESAEAFRVFAAP